MKKKLIIVALAALATLTAATAQASIEDQSFHVASNNSRTIRLVIWVPGQEVNERTLFNFKDPEDCLDAANSLVNLDRGQIVATCSDDRPDRPLNKRAGNE